MSTLTTVASGATVSTKNHYTITSLTPLRDNVFVTEIEQGVALTRGGILIPDDNMRETGIKPRWAKVWAVGPEVEDLAVGEWVLVEHGRWTNRISLTMPEGDVDVWRIDYPAAVLLVSNEDPRLTSQTAF